ncbi:3-phosphoserine/phosphohydroxythreonine transaminase [Planktosalinus lacus]|uniref:Phosphoserine aminotransferase n=1 Tax=Planktosalinus lacus TaxID=1526573 RepID=A0A8J2VAG6_9FLAO|nr:3-phosphoserine/phosphohydroxythreonine transaminase [Planktosalinus lacus]GGD92997.1 phosphoserine aminotransferase [Planktosalinus lacus]
MKKHNFSAGPGILPREVIEQASVAVQNYNNTGLSILEISHRSKEFVAVMEQARQLALELTGLEGKGYRALFMHGGASLQFVMVAQNLLERKAAYINTGTWASKAIQEARFFGEVLEVASSKDQDFTYIPKEFEIPTGISYLHCTSNNTIYGTQFKKFPESSAPLVCDMSSDIFSRDIDYSQFDLIYAGAQKNMGPAGTTLVLVKESVLGKVSRAIPNYMNYRQHIEKESMFNTPSVFAVYCSMLTLEWIKARGGVSEIEKENSKKASLLYKAIDSNNLFVSNITNIEDRSMMNVTFRLQDDSHKEMFEKLVAQAGINGLNGHRSVGGYRASIYNALPFESVQLLVDTMQQLKNKV